MDRRDGMRNEETAICKLKLAVKRLFIKFQGVSEKFRLEKPFSRTIITLTKNYDIFIENATKILFFSLFNCSSQASCTHICRLEEEKCAYEWIWIREIQKKMVRINVRGSRDILFQPLTNHRFRYVLCWNNHTRACLTNDAQPTDLILCSKSPEPRIPLLRL